MKTFGNINLNRDGSGSISLEPEEEEDLWHLFNIICEGDQVKARTTRKVKLERDTGKSSVQVKKIVVTLEVIRVDFEPNDQSMRILGRNLVEHEDIKLGQHHTAEVGLHERITLEKNNWDFAARDRLREASDARMNAEVAAVLIDGGTAALYVLTNSLVKDCGKCHGNLGKSNAFGKADKQKIKFFESIMLAMRNQFKIANMKCILIGGPGDLKDQFYDWLFDAAVQKGVTDISSRKKIFVKGLASNSGKNALTEMLQDPAIAARMADTKAIGEVALLRKYHKMANDDPLRACYGAGPVSVAFEQGAIDTLLISDQLFRSSVLKHRVFFSEMAQSVKDAGGNVTVVAALGVAGDQIKNLAGICAILRFPCYDLEDLEPGYLPEAMK